LSSSFDKYKIAGAYHWDIFSRNLARHHLFTLARYNSVLEAAKIQDGESVCDLGCGDGALTFLIWQLNQTGRIVGVDPDVTGRKLAAEMFKSKGACAIFLDSCSAIPDCSQDVVICAEVIEHVAEPEKIMQEITRILKPGGRCVISTPVASPGKMLDDQHVREFSPNQLQIFLGNYLKISDHLYSTSAFALSLYQWSPKFFFRKPVLRYLINAINLWFGINLLRKFKFSSKWVTQLVVCVKE
jgi:2-polyprenyl-3-methyl-5-hydroxy-6-metoxy-1,4-benzoquinol methylase